MSALIRGLSSIIGKIISFFYNYVICKPIIMVLSFLKT